MHGGGDLIRCQDGSRRGLLLACPGALAADAIPGLACADGGGWLAVGVGQADGGEFGGERPPGRGGFGEGGGEGIVVTAHPAIEGRAAWPAMGAEGGEHLGQTAVLGWLAAHGGVVSGAILCCRASCNAATGEV